MSSPEKAQLAAAAGADHVINYRQQDVVTEVRKIAPKGVDAIVEVNPAVNAATTPRSSPCTAPSPCTPTTRAPR